MDRKIKTVVILTLILMGLCVAFACITLWMAGDDTPATPSGQSQGETLLACDPTTLTSLSFTYDKDGDGVAELWRYTCEAGVFCWGENPDIPLSTEGFQTLVSALASLKSSHTLYQVPSEMLSTYGLLEPSKAIRINDAVYGEQVVYLGAFNAYNQMYYAYVGDDTTTVYMVSSDIYQLFEYPVEAFVVYDDIPQEIEISRVVSLSYERGEAQVVLTPQPLYEENSGDTPTLTGYTWLKTQNGETVALSEQLSETLTAHLTGMSYLACASVDKTADSTYGFDKDTATMTWVYLDKAGERQTFVLTLGGQTDGGYYYVRPQGTDYIMLLDGTSFAQVFENSTTDTED